MNDTALKSMAAHFFDMFPNGGWLSLYVEEPVTEQRGWWPFKRTVVVGARKVERSPRVYAKLAMTRDGYGFVAEPVKLNSHAPASWVGIHASETGELLEMAPNVLTNVRGTCVAYFSWSMRCNDNAFD